MSRALEGIRTIDLSRVLAAPTTSVILANLGAEMVHMEPEGEDDSRALGPFIGGHYKNRSGYIIPLSKVTTEEGHFFDDRSEAPE